MIIQRFVRLATIFFVVAVTCIAVESVFTRSAYAASTTPCPPITTTRINLEIEETLNVCQTNQYLDNLGSTQTETNIIAIPLCAAAALAAPACAEIIGILNLGLVARQNQIKQAFDSCVPQAGVIIDISIDGPPAVIGIRGNC